MKKIFRTLPTARPDRLAGCGRRGARRQGRGRRSSRRQRLDAAAKPLADAIHDALRRGGTGRRHGAYCSRTSLFPSGALTGQAGSALMTRHPPGLWMNANGGRLELQSDAGDAQIVWTDTTLTVYDASSNTAYTVDLPKPQDSVGTTAPAAPTLDEITTFLTDLGKNWVPCRGRAVECRRAGGLHGDTVSPSHDGGCSWLRPARLGRCERHTAQGRCTPRRSSSSPMLALQKRPAISFGSISRIGHNSLPAAGAQVVDLSSQTGRAVSGGSANAPVTGLAAVQAAAPFTVVAPDTLVGLPRRDVRLVGPADSRSVLVVYGQGLGAIVVVERKPDAAKAGQGGMLDALPSISLDGVTAHELATQLGTVLTWDHGGVSSVLAVSIPTSGAESAARSLGCATRRRSKREDWSSALRRHRRGRSRRPDGRAWRRVRIPRSERGRQDDVAARCCSG